MTNIIDLTFNAKRKRNFYGQTTYIVKVSFFDVSASIYNYLAFNLKKKPNLIVTVYNLNKFLLGNTYVNFILLKLLFPLKY
jgi:hypothetical protein